MIGAAFLPDAFHIFVLCHIQDHRQKVVPLYDQTAAARLAVKLLKPLERLPDIADRDISFIVLSDQIDYILRARLRCTAFFQFLNRLFSMDADLIPVGDMEQIRQIFS